MSRCAKVGDLNFPVSNTARIPQTNAARPTMRPKVPRPGRGSAFSSVVDSTNRKSRAYATELSIGRDFEANGRLKRAGLPADVPNRCFRPVAVAVSIVETYC